MEVVRSKAQNYRLWQGGFYGNKLRAWRSLPELCASGYEGPVVIRYLGSTGGNWCFYDVPFDLAAQATLDIEAEGGDIGRIMYNEPLPNESIVLQGEIWTGADPLYWMRYSREKLKMRDAMALKSQVERGIKSLNLLKGAMSPSSWSDFECLIERYPDHAIEFTVCSGPIGDTPGRNAVVWEVRRY